MAADVVAQHGTPEQVQQILSIEPPKQLCFERPPAEVIPVEAYRARSRDIVDFLIRRETELERVATN